MASSDNCTNCGAAIEVMAFKGTGYCGENCRKIDSGEIERPKSQTDAGITNLIMPSGGLDTRGIR